AVDEVVDDPGRGDAVNRDPFEEAILFGHPDHVATVRIFPLAFVDDLRRHPVARAELILDPPVVRKDQTNRLIAIAHTSFTQPDVSDLAAVLLPVAAQEILETRTNRLLEVFDLLRRLV